MSTIYESTTGASNCIDGVTASCTWPCSTPYLCHTSCNPQEWLVVAVTGFSVNKVVVYNRAEGCEDRINNAKLIYSYDFAGTSIIHQASFGSTVLSTYTFDFSTTTYVRIQQTTSNAISLLEVALYNNNVKIPISGEYHNNCCFHIHNHHPLHTHYYHHYHLNYISTSSKYELTISITICIILH